MSYDLQLIPRGRVAEYLRRYEETDADSVEINPGPIVPTREAWKQRVYEGLISADSRLARFPFDYSEIARIDSISETTARERYRHIELNLPDDDTTGIQITLHDETASVTIPYWHERAAAIEVFQQVWRYLSVMESVGELTSYDPQLEKILSVADDCDQVLERYLEVVARIPEIVVHSSLGKKPWWKFW